MTRGQDIIDWYKKEHLDAMQAHLLARESANG